MVRLEDILRNAGRLILAGTIAACTLLSPELEAREPRPSQAKVRIARVCNLEAIYMGVPTTVKEVRKYRGKTCAKIGKKHQPDYSKVLEALWDTKISLYQSNRGVLTQARDATLQKYRTNPRKMSLTDYLTFAEKVVNDAYNGISWDKAEEGYEFKKHQQGLLKKAMRTIRGKELVAYAITELFPTRNGTRNEKILEYMLREGGATFVESIPALYDPYCSFGLFQFTSLALHGPKKRGASQMNQYLKPDQRIPGSMIYLDGEEGDHFRAAYLFAAHNLAQLIRNLNPKQARSLDIFLDQTQRDDDLIQYIAVSHHNPARGLRGAKRWLDNGARADFSVSVSGGLRGYALKTKNNYAALKR